MELYIWFMFVHFETGFHYVVLAALELAMWTDWPEVFKDSSASASGILELKACVLCLTLYQLVFKVKIHQFCLFYPGLFTLHLDSSSFITTLITTPSKF